MTITIQEWNNGSEDQRRQWLSDNVLIRHTDIAQLEWQVKARETRKLRLNRKRVAP